MTEEELKIWFLHKINSCYIAKHDDYPDCIIYIYDESYIRRKKLCILNNEEIKPQNSLSGVVLFEQNLLEKTLFCDYGEIWEFFNINYIHDFDSIYLFINNIINDIDKFKSYTCNMGIMFSSYYLKEIEKSKTIAL